MARPSDPSKRALLLDRCFETALARGSVTLTLDELAEGAGTSARMLVYHFGTRDALEQALASQLEERVRARFAAMVLEMEHQSSARDTDPSQLLTRVGSPPSLHSVGMAMWSEFTTPGMLALLRLTAGMRARAIAGDVNARRVIEAEMNAWLAMLTANGLTEDEALVLLMFGDGAISDMLSSGDTERGRRALALLVGRLGDSRAPATD